MPRDGHEPGPVLDQLLAAGAKADRPAVCVIPDGCQYCGRPFDVIRFRWLCPHCKAKNTCCE